MNPYLIWAAEHRGLIREWREYVRDGYEVTFNEAVFYNFFRY